MKVLTFIVGVLSFVPPSHAGGIPCESRINVLMEAWGLGHLTAGKVVKGEGKQVTVSGHDSPSMKQITLVYSKGGVKNMKVVVDKSRGKSSCVLSSAEVYVDGPNVLKTPARIDGDACQKIFLTQQSTPYHSDPSEKVFDEFQEGVLKQSIPGWKQITDPETKHAYKARFIPNCGQTPNNAGLVKDRIGALGYLSWREADLRQYFVKKDFKRQGQGLEELEKASSADDSH